LRVLREHRVAGIILGLGDAQLRAKVPSLQRQVAILRQAGIPTVSVDKRVAGMDSVMLDNVRAAAQAVEHLIRLGHERIGIITGPLWTTTGRGRLIGYRRAMRRAGLPLERSLQGIGPFSQQSGATLAQAMLSHRDWPTALIAASNDLTLGVLSAVAPIGLHIPGDLALVGFDEMNWASTLMSPLTTVVQPAKEMGAAACRLLLDRITGDVTGPAQRLHFPGRLIVRQSSGAPADEQDPGPNFLHLISGPQNVCSTYVGPAAMLTIEMKGG
jgi:LacI family transcriptional regulator